VLGRVRLDREAHVPRVLLGLGAQVARVFGELLLEPFRFDGREPLELGCLDARLVANSLGGLLGRLEDAGDVVADGCVAESCRAARPRFRWRVRSRPLAAPPLLPESGKLNHRASPGKPGRAFPRETLTPSRGAG
jgi:hypothetical protein